MDTTSMSVAHDGHVVIDLPAQVIHISQDDLRVIVQAAYDSYGILAAPSYDVEAERAPEVPDVLGMIHAHVNAAHEAQARTVAARYPLLAAATVSA